MEQCIEITIPGFKTIKFENIGRYSLDVSNILNDIISQQTDMNVAGLHELQAIFTEDIKPANVLTDLDANNIGDNVVGNASIEGLSKVLFRTNSENTKMFLPMLSMLKSNGIFTGQDVILLTNNTQIGNRIYLGNKYSRIVLNPESETFLNDLYRGLGYYFIEKQISKKRSNYPISQQINSAFSKMYLDSDLDPGIREKLENIKGLSFVQKQRAFLNFAIDPTNGLSKNPTVKQLLLDLDEQIQGALAAEMEDLRSHITYEKSKLEEDQKRLKASRSKSELLNEIDNIETASEYLTFEEYRNDQYLKDQDLIKNTDVNGIIKRIESIRTTRNSDLEKLSKLRISNNNKKLDLNGKNKVDIKSEAQAQINGLNQIIASAKDANTRIQKYEKFKRKIENNSENVINLAEELKKNTDINPEERLNESRKTLDEINLIQETIKKYHLKKKAINSTWNLFSIEDSVNFTEDLLPNTVTVSVPDVIDFNGLQVSTEDLKKFLQEYPNLKYKRGIVEQVTSDDLIAILETLYDKDNINLLLPQNPHQRLYLKNNPELFKTLWNINNTYNVDGQVSFSPEAIINEKLRQHFMFTIPNVKKMFNFESLKISSNTNSFQFNEPIVQIKNKKTFNENLSKSIVVKFVNNKNLDKVSKNTLLVDENFSDLPTALLNYLSENRKLKDSITRLYVDTKTSTSSEDVELRLVKVIHALQNTANIATIDTIMVSGLDELQTKIIEVGMSEGLKAKVYTEDSTGFRETYKDFQTRSYENNVNYTFDEHFSIRKSDKVAATKHKTAFIQGEVSGLLYSRQNSEKGKTFKNAGPGNIITIGTDTQVLVKDKIKFLPISIFSRNMDPNVPFSVGTFVTRKSTKEKMFVTDVLDGKATLMNEYTTVKDVDINDLEFIAQSKVITHNDSTYVLTTNPKLAINASTGFIKTIDNDMMKLFYEEIFSRMSDVSGYKIESLYNQMGESNFDQFEVIETEIINDIALTSGTKQISIDDAQTIISKLARKLNDSGVKTRLMTIEEMIEEGLSEYEYGHPAFIKTVDEETTMFVNIEHRKLTPGTLIHELSHLILGYVKSNSANYQEYMRMIDKVNISAEMFKKYRNRYKNRTAVDIKEEILADLFSNYFNNYIQDYNGLEENFENLDLKDVFGKMFGILENIPEDISNQELMNMSINDAVTTTSSIYNTAVKLFGVDQKSVIKRRLANIEQELIASNKLKETCE